MQSLDVIVGLPHGAHVMPAYALAKLAGGFNSVVSLRTAHGMYEIRTGRDVLRAVIQKGAFVTVTCDGDDEDRAVRAVADFLECTGCKE